MSYREDPGARERQAFLGRVRMATRCDASWEGMSGDDRVRHCALCDRKVYDLSSMSSAEAVALLTEHEGDRTPCIRLHRRRDGTVMTSDCPRGRSARKRRLAVLGALSAGAITLATTGDRVVDALTPPAFDARVPEELVLGEPYVEAAVFGRHARFVDVDGSDALMGEPELDRGGDEVDGPIDELLADRARAR